MVQYCNGFQLLPLIRRDQLRRGRRGGSTQIGHQIDKSTSSDWLAMIVIPAAICAVALFAFSRRLGDEKMLAGK